MRAARSGHARFEFEIVDLRIESQDGEKDWKNRTDAIAITMTKKLDAVPSDFYTLFWRGGDVGLCLPT
jgi:hypothetical protein